jgi:uncharacterized RDD family membrane protein YckC
MRALQLPEPTLSPSLISSDTEFPSLWRRLWAVAYESLPIMAIVVSVGFAFVGVLAILGVETARLSKSYRIALFGCWYSAIGAYFVFFWRHGQTLPMRAWRLRLTAKDGGSVPVPNLIGRFALGSLAWCAAVFAIAWVREHPDSAVGWACLLPITAALGWVLFDPKKQTLYDRAAGTILVVEPRPLRS